LTELAFHVDATAVGEDDLIGDVKPEAEATVVPR
jgi:hypothetical protein